MSVAELEEIKNRYVWKGIDLERFHLLEILPQNYREAAIVLRHKTGGISPWCVEYRGCGKYFETREEMEKYIEKRKFRKVGGYDYEH